MQANKFTRTFYTKCYLRFLSNQHLENERKIGDEDAVSLVKKKCPRNVLKSYRIFNAIVYE